MKIENMHQDSRFSRGFGVYVAPDAVVRAEWTGETVEQAQAAINAERNVNTVKIRTGGNVLPFQAKS